MDKQEKILYDSTMKHYAFILGRESKLSLAELLQVLRAEEVESELIEYSLEVAIIKAPLITEELFHRLGGSIKLVEIEQVKEQALAETMKKMALSQASKTDDRVYLGLSVYPLDDANSKKQIHEQTKLLRRELFTIKKALKEQKNSVRIVESKDDQLSSVVVQKNKLLSKRGIEFVILKSEQSTWVGRTMAVQDFEAFADRDHGRPYRDDRSGMLPPKLARTMLNLAGKSIDSETTVLDPFCGSGTVLQEASLLGAYKVLGSDLSKKAVMDSVGNVSWLKDKFDLQTDIRVEQVDVTELISWLPENYIDLIATEPYLGEPVRGKLSKAEIKERQDALSRLYDEALIQMHSVLKPGGILVMIFPYIQNSRLPLPRHMGRLFEQIVVHPNVVSSNRNGIDYQRPGQHVGREIMVLRKPIR